MKSVESLFAGSRELGGVLTNERDHDLALIANILDNAWLQAKKGNERGKFLEDVDKVADSLSRVAPDYLLIPGRTFEGRRQPGLVEALHETTRRLVFVEKLLEDLPQSVEGLMVVGSMSYGRFFNVRSQPENPSDVDIFLVAGREFFQEKEGKRVVNSANGFDSRTCEVFPQRLGIFLELLARGEAHMMSIKSPIDGFLASIKIMPMRTFEYEFSAVPEELMRGFQDRTVVIRDYKQRHYPATSFTQYNFSHEPFNFKLDGQYETDLGAIVPIPCAVVKDGRFYTGLHHNHVIPRFEAEVDSTGVIVGTLERFKAQLLSRARLEKDSFGGDVRPINCHDKRDILSPFVVAHFERV